jgi:hypothetical protein
MKSSAAGLLEFAISATSSKGVCAMAAIAMLALTGNGMAAQMTQFPNNQDDYHTGHPCHDSHYPVRHDWYIKMTVLNSEINALADKLGEGGLPDGITLAPEMCELLRQVNEAQDGILASWYAEKECDKNEKDPWPYIDNRISVRQGLKAKTISKLKQCRH